MERKYEIEKELSGLAPVLGKNGTTALPYRAPAGYFEQFSDDLPSRIRNDQGLLLPELNIIEFGTGLVEEDLTTETDAIPPFLAKLDRKSPYRVPDDYFREFKPNISEAVMQHLRPEAKETKLVPIRARGILRYAVAALFAGVVAATAFFAIHKPAADPLNGLTNISDQDMANYLDSQDVHWVPVASPATLTASVDFSDNDISDLLSNISDTELEQYLPDLPDHKQTIN